MRVLDVPDGELEGQVVEGRVGFDFCKGALERGGGRVGLEGVQGAAVGGGGKGGGEGRVAGAGEEGHGEVAVGRRGEDACDARGGIGAGAQEDGEAGGWHGWVGVECERGGCRYGIDSGRGVDGKCGWKGVRSVPMVVNGVVVNWLGGSGSELETGV